MDTIRVTLRSERLRFVEPTRIPDDFTWERSEQLEKVDFISLPSAFANI